MSAAGRGQRDREGEARAEREREEVEAVKRQHSMTAAAATTTSGGEQGTGRDLFEALLESSLRWCREWKEFNSDSLTSSLSLDPTEFAPARFSPMHHERIDPPRPVVTAKRSTLNHRDGERSPHPHSDRPSSLTDVEKATPTTYPDSNDDRRGGNNDDDYSGFLFKLGRHFVGKRDSRSFKSPIVRPLAKLSPKHEGYLVAFLGAFVAILGACAISFAFKDVKGFRGVTPLAIGSLGATAVLLYCVPESPLSQPRNVVGGHVVSAVSGAIVSQLFALDSRFTTPLDVDNAVVDDESWYHLTPVAYALAVAIAISAMQLTKTVHPRESPPASKLFSRLTPFPALL